MKEGLIERLMTTNAAMMTLREYCLPYPGVFSYLMVSDDRLLHLTPMEMLSGQRFAEVPITPEQRRMLGQPMDDRKRQVFNCLK